MLPLRSFHLEPVIVRTYFILPIALQHMETNAVHAIFEGVIPVKDYDQKQC